ncbi:hypothetical protein PSHT_09568 [Puccinia striiformis]|uniref:Uncharacterized protein n=1 Tax=Puccinia striiformis TaxID=27350 RepID=A0A2S4VFU3_9BASI|nr:hypothetical protein PSHT_09568 [Puccinia striiformis]
MVELWAGPVSSGLNDFGENKSCFDVYFGDYADAPCVQPGIAPFPTYSSHSTRTTHGRCIILFQGGLPRGLCLRWISRLISENKRFVHWHSAHDSSGAPKIWVPLGISDRSCSVLSQVL